MATRCPNTEERSNGAPLHHTSGGPWRATLLPRGPYEAAYTPDRDVIGFAFDSQVGTHAFAGDRRKPFRARPNGLAHVPAGCDVYSSSRHGGEYLTVVRTGSPDQIRRPQRRFSDVADPIALKAARLLRNALLAPRPIEPLHLEALAVTLQDQIDRHLFDRIAPPRSSGWMTPRRMQRIEDAIDAGLGQPLSVADLARLLDLSEGFFTRAFKSATGVTPHAYVIDRRIARARQLMENPDLGLSFIAQAVGFSSHAHMTALFSSRLGVTPSQLRATLQ